MPRKLIFPTTLLVLLIIGWRSLQGSAGGVRSSAPERTQASAVKVVATEVVLAANNRKFTAVGTGRALRSVDLFAPVAEQVRSLRFSAGQSVAAGDLLIQLDDDAEQLAVELANVELEEARGLLARYERAVKDGGVPQSEVDSARA